MVSGSWRWLSAAAQRVVQRGPRPAPPVPRTAGGAAPHVMGQPRQTRAVAARQVPYGERPARNRQLTLLAELLGTDWRQAVPARFGVAIGDLNRRQAAAAIRQLTGGVRPAHVARGTWHRVAVDPDWIERPRGSRRRAATPGSDVTSAGHAAGEPPLPIQLKALRLLGERVGLDVVAAAPARYGCDLGRLDRRTAAAWIAELTPQVLEMPAHTTTR